MNKVAEYFNTFRVKNVSSSTSFIPFSVLQDFIEFAMNAS